MRPGLTTIIQPLKPLEDQVRSGPTVICTLAPAKQVVPTRMGLPVGSTSTASVTKTGKLIGCFRFRASSAVGMRVKILVSRRR